MDTSPGHRVLRLGRYSRPSQIYLLTTTTFRRRPIFHDWGLAGLACSALSHPLAWGDASLLCWVLMPDHWHGLVCLGERDPLPLVVNRFKARVAKALHCKVPSLQQIWARAYHDHALRAEDDMLDVARYVVCNPVRAGLVARVWDYPFWDAVWL